MKQMKRISGLLALAILLLTPGLAAAAGQLGVYVAPKFVYGSLKGHDMKNNYWDYDSGSLASHSVSNYAMKGDDIYGGALAVGYDFQKRLGVPVRLELEYALFSDAKTKRGNAWHDLTGSGESSETKYELTLGIQSLFANVYYDFRNSSAFTPYLGFGLGLAFVSAKGKYTDEMGGYYYYSEHLKKDTSTNFAWNVGAGLAYAFTDYISLDLAYRFLSLGKGETKRNIVRDWRPIDDEYEVRKYKTDDLYIHQLALGLRVTF